MNFSVFVLAVFAVCGVVTVPCEVLEIFVVCGVVTVPCVVSQFLVLLLYFVKLSQFFAVWLLYLVKFSRLLRFVVW